MNEEELKEEEMWTCPICKEENFFDYPCKNGCEKKINKKRLEEQRDDLISYTLGYQEGFQKGKLEERERITNYLIILLEECKLHLSVNHLNEYWVGKQTVLEQLQKEIGGDEK